MSEESYKNKYFKYKSKYLDLKEKLGGAPNRNEEIYRRQLEAYRNRQQQINQQQRNQQQSNQQQSNQQETIRSEYLPVNEIAANNQNQNRRNLPNNYNINIDVQPAHITATVQNIILRYGNITEFGITQAEQIAGSVSDLSLQTQSSIWCPLIWHALSRHYNVPRNILDASRIISPQLNAAVDELSAIPGWADYAVRVLTTPFNNIPFNSNDFFSDYVIANSNAIASSVRSSSVSSSQVPRSNPQVPRSNPQVQVPSVTSQTIPNFDQTRINVNPVIYNITVRNLESMLGKPANEITTRDIANIYCDYSNCNNIIIRSYDRNGTIVPIDNRTLRDYNLTYQDLNLNITILNPATLSNQRSSPQVQVPSVRSSIRVPVPQPQNQNVFRPGGRISQN
tara:strand:- start:225 stop:1409 length:1185 start_codon:yes stop_codon:yes gene_type:complete